MIRSRDRNRGLKIVAATGGGGGTAGKLDFSKAPQSGLLTLFEGF